METPKERKARLNRERQARFRNGLIPEQVHLLRMSHNASARRSYYKSRNKQVGEGSVQEKLFIKQATLKPETKVRKAKKTKDELDRLYVFNHYKKLLNSSYAHIRQPALAWFRVVMGEFNPYYKLAIGFPSNFSEAELTRHYPHQWRFHATKLMANFHPEF